MNEQFKQILNSIFEKEISTCIQKGEEVVRVKICGFDDGEYEDVFVEIAIFNNETDKYYEKKISLLDQYENFISEILEIIMNNPTIIKVEVKQIVESYSFVSDDVRVIVEEID